MKIFFSPKNTLIKVAEEERRCRLCGTRDHKNSGSLAVVHYSLMGEQTATKFHRTKVRGCATCDNTGKIKSEPPVFTKCPTCAPGADTPRGVGQGMGLYRPKVCPTCYNSGPKIVPSHGGGIDDTLSIKCRTCGGDTNNIPLKTCPECSNSERPGFVQHGESSHDILCPSCKGSRTTSVTTPYTPILEVKCPHLNGVDTFTPPDPTNNVEGNVGPYDRNYFEGQRLLPLKLLWNIRGINEKYHHKINYKVYNPSSPFRGETREVGMLIPPLPTIQRKEEPTYLDLFSKPELLDPDISRTASNSFKRSITYFNSKLSKSNNSDNGTPSDEDNNVNSSIEDFFGHPGQSDQENSSSGSNIFDDLLSDELVIDPIRREKAKSPEEQRRLHGGPVTVRQQDESDYLRPFLKDPTRAKSRVKSLLGAQKQLSEKRSRMSQMFQTMNSIDNEPDKDNRERLRSYGTIPSFRSWRNNLHQVSMNLDYFNQIRSVLRNHLSGIIGKRMRPEIATALTSQVFREGKKIQSDDGRVIDLSQHRLGITEPMPYIKNDESWRESHEGLGCNHDPNDGHEPDVGCIVDYFNHSSNPKNGVTTGTNSRLVVGKYTADNGRTILRTVGSRLKRSNEFGTSKRGIRGTIPTWTPENFGRIVELPVENATCVPNNIQRDHYTVNHTLEPPSERQETTPLPVEETGLTNRSSEPILNKEKIKFPEEIRMGGPTESVYVGNPLYQLSNPFSTQEVESGMWANNPAVQHIVRQIKNGKRPKKFKPYIPEPKFNSQVMRNQPGLAKTPSLSIEKELTPETLDISDLFGELTDGSDVKKTSKREENKINPVEQDADETYDYNKKIKIQPMDRTQVSMVEPTNPSTPDITPDVPKVNNK